MTAAPVIEIAELILPVASQHAAERVAMAINEEAARLYATDRAAGLDWSGDLQSIALDYENDAGPEQIGRSVALQIRNRVVSDERIRGERR